MARPSKWDELDMPSKLESITGWAKQGSTNEEMAKMLGVSLAVLYEWKKKYPEFKEAIKKGQMVADGELLNSAFQQSTGFKYREQQGFKVKAWESILDPATGIEKLVQVEHVEVVEVEKFCPPNPTMNIFMLKNRLPDQYKDKREHELTGKDGGPLVISIESALESLDDG